MLDRIYLRFQKQIQGKTNDVGYETPNYSEQRLAHQIQATLALSKAQFLIDGVDELIDALEEMLEEIHHDVE